MADLRFVSNPYQEQQHDSLVFLQLCKMEKENKIVAKWKQSLSTSLQQD